ncbi:hypothetical protein I3843_10G141400 [Carya illinoinensis]|nr:hypothetical protein I3843_10G141400 [Carya illinoinensis]
MADEVLLFGAWASPFSRRIEIALKLKGVEYKYFQEDLYNKSPSLLKYNPIHKKVPVLVHNGKCILESQVILEYIDETWKGYPIFPRDPYEKAIARFWSKFIDEKCLPVVFNACWGEKKEHQKAEKEATELLKYLENELGEKKYFGGEAIGYLDIVANLVAFWVGVFEEASGTTEFMTREKFPRLRNWADEFVNSSAVKRKYPSSQRQTNPLFPKSILGRRCLQIEHFTQNMHSQLVTICLLKNLGSCVSEIHYKRTNDDSVPIIMVRICFRFLTSFPCCNLSFVFLISIMNPRCLLSLMI